MIETGFDFEDRDYVEKWTKDPELYWYEKMIVDKFFARRGSVLVGGCGAGRDSVAFARMGYDVAAFDISKGMIKTACKLYTNEKNVCFGLGDAAHLAFAEQLFEHYVLSCQTMNFVDDFRDAVSEAFRVLNEDGIFTFTMHNPYSVNAIRYRSRMLNFCLHNPFRVEWELKRIGFRDVSINSLRTLSKPASFLSKFPFKWFHHLLIFVCRK